MGMARDMREVGSLPSWEADFTLLKDLELPWHSITRSEDNTASEQRRHGISKEKH